MDTNTEHGFAADPLQHIPPALLNSADIQAYQDACQILRGEAFDKRRLKSASYEICCKGEVFWSDSSGEFRRQRIDEGQPFVLEKNQIVFLSPDVAFCLPDYLAARFNLTISLVHKGLLLGTGPMVDPGFEGRLLIPLHNLTSSRVHLTASEGFIWVEFTKLSPYIARPDEKFSFIPFPESKKRRNVETYFRESEGVPRRSSLQETLQIAIDAADKAQKALGAAVEQERRLQRRVRTATITSFAGIAVAAAALLWATYSFWAQSVAIVRDAQQWASDARRDKDGEMSTLKAKLDAIERQLNARKGSDPTPTHEPQKAAVRDR